MTVEQVFTLIKLFFSVINFVSPSLFPSLLGLDTSGELRTENLERALQILADGKDGGRVVELTTVVLSREDGQQLAISGKLVAVLGHLDPQCLYLSEIT